MIEFRVDGMTCGHCVSAVTRAVKSVDLAAGTVSVEGSGSPEALSRAIGEAGYPAYVPGAQLPKAARKSGGCCAA